MILCCILPYCANNIGIVIFYWPLSALPPPNQVLYVHSFIRCQYNCIQTSTLTVNPATYMLYSIYPDDKVLIGSNKVIRTEFISQPRDRREKSISGQYISIFSRRLFWQKQSITHIILGPPRQILQIIGSSDISSFEPLHSNWLWLEWRNRSLWSYYQCSRVLKFQ